MKKILIIEDDVEAQELYKQALVTSGFEVHQAVNGQEGLELAKSIVPQLIILDVMLPGGLNGFDVLEQLKRDKNLSVIPVLVLTNLDTEESTAKSIGVADYLVKTEVSLDEIVKKVKKILTPINSD